MQQAEESSSDEGCENRFLQGRQETIHKKRLQPDFLKEAKSKITRKPMRLYKPCGKTMSCAEEQSHRGNWHEKNTKHQGRAPSRWPQIVRTPAKGLWSVAVQGETKDQPHGKSDPRIKRA